MKTGMCLFLWTTHVTEDHAPLLRDIKACGFTGVEVPIFGGTIDHYTRLGALLDEIGLDRTAVSAMGDSSMNLIGDSAAQAAGDRSGGPLGAGRLGADLGRGGSCDRGRHDGAARATPGG